MIWRACTLMHLWLQAAIVIDVMHMEISQLVKVPSRAKLHLMALCAQCHVQHSAVLSQIEVLALEHGLNFAFQVGLLCQVEQ